MKTQELRVGNLVMLNPEKIISETCIIKVESLHSWGINLRDGRDGIEPDYSEDHILPIPLTEEWLDKSGLTKEYLENPFEKGGYDLDENGNRWYKWVDKGTFNLEIQANGEIWFEIYSCYRHIRYVHELQNLYFALTGEELTIK